MSKGNIITGIVFLVLSVVVTYGVAIIDFLVNKTKNVVGFPFAFSSFNFLGSETNQTMLFVDIIFWFIVLFGIWKLILRLIKR
jgi:hypothetical protein